MNKTAQANASLALRIIAAVLISVAKLSGATPDQPLPQPRNGDIVFQDSEVDAEGHKHSGQAAPIKELTRSDWSHMGIYFVRPDKGAVVVEAIGVAHKEIAWAEWRSHGAEGRYAIRRLKGGLDDAAVDKLYRVATDYAGRPYDFKFAWDDAAIYCSELVWKTFHDALGKDFGQVQRLGDFDLDSESARKLIERPASWGSISKVPRDEKAVSPQAVLVSTELEEVD